MASDTNLELSIDGSIKSLISSEIAWHYRILPKSKENGTLYLFIDQNNNTLNTKQEIEFALNGKIKLFPQESDSIEKALLVYYRRDERRADTPTASFNIQDKDFVFKLIEDARALKSSDIHIEIYDQFSRIRFRIDGNLVERIRVPKHDYPALINKVKIMAGLDISEKRLPQDGRIFYNQNNHRFDIRVSVLPSLYGEKIVLRILGGSSANVELNDLGFSSTDLKRYQEAIQKPSGIILISGPTGSGKTTTLYATLKDLNKLTDNIVTIEDPIEYTLEGVNQVQVKEDIGLTFSEALRSFLRQDPDIIMVGEIRDAETANLAIRAALTGHLVLSTIHTNSAWGTISRLTDMGTPPFLLANTLVASLAQRLVRLLCPVCKELHPLDEKMLPDSFLHKQRIKEHYVSKGCKACYFTGYQGRKAIYEMIPVNAQVGDLIINKQREVAPYFKSIGVKTLQDSALEILLNGQTSIEEIYPYLLDDQY